MLEERRIDIENKCYIIDKYEKDGNHYMRQYYDSDGKLHRVDNKPAYVTYHTGTRLISYSGYHIHGLNIRTDGEPSRITYDLNGFVLGFGVTNNKGETIGHYLAGAVKIDEAIHEPLNKHYYKFSIVL